MAGSRSNQDLTQTPHNRKTTNWGPNAGSSPARSPGNEAGKHVVPQLWPQGGELTLGIAIRGGWEAHLRSQTSDGSGPAPSPHPAVLFLEAAMEPGI